MCSDAGYKFVDKLLREIDGDVPRLFLVEGYSLTGRSEICFPSDQGWRRKVYHSRVRNLEPWLEFGYRHNTWSIWRLHVVQFAILWILDNFIGHPPLQNQLAKVCFLSVYASSSMAWILCIRSYSMLQSHFGHWSFKPAAFRLVGKGRNPHSQTTILRSIVQATGDSLGARVSEILGYRDG